MKIAVIGCGLRTPLLIHGLARARPDLQIDELALYDTAPERAEIMARMGEALAGGALPVIKADHLEQAVEDAHFVISSIRPGGIEARARDERLAVEHGFAGQETTGPAGQAMALRVLPYALEQARLVAKLAPDAWIVNFTNPAGMVTQAITQLTGAKAVGICDTPAEVFHQISLVLQAPVDELEFDYIGLNHLGWIRGVKHHGRERLTELLEDDAKLRRLYPADLFDPAFLRALQAIPTEYLFFYYAKSRALANQRKTGVTRGEELLRMNTDLFGELSRVDSQEAIRIYRSYLNRRNASYFRLEAEGGSALSQPDPGWDPFEGATGYHRIAVETIRALTREATQTIVLNVANGGTFAELDPTDVIEHPCRVNQYGALPLPTTPLPEPIRGLITAVKMYERLTIRSIEEENSSLAALALSANPIMGEWEPARRFLQTLINNNLSDFRLSGSPKAQFGDPLAS